MEVNKVYQGDSAELMKKLPDNFIDLTVTSPPYDNLRDYNGFKFDFETIAKELYRVTKQGGIVVWVIGDETKNFCESLSSFKQAIFFVEVAGFNLLDTMVYKKRSSPPAYPTLRRYTNQFEYMFVFSKGKPKTFNQIKEPRESTLNTNSTYRQKDGSFRKKHKDSDTKFKLKSNVWEYKTGFIAGEEKIKFEHPATFPDKLPEEHIISWSNKGDLVFDPFAGSGTTLKMAMLNDRNYLGFEISAEYCNLINKRIGSNLSGFIRTSPNGDFSNEKEHNMGDKVSATPSPKSPTATSHHPNINRNNNRCLIR